MARFLFAFSLLVTLLGGFDARGVAAPTPTPSPTPCAPKTGSQLCVTGPGWPYPPNVVANANVVNLYMAAGGWDALVPAGSGVTKEALDSWTSAFIASGYLASGAQYGIGTPTFGGGFLSAAKCVPTASGSTPSLSTSDASGVISCNFGTGGALHGLHNTVANLIVPPPWNILDGIDGIGSTCTTIGGYHATTLDVNLVPFTVIPVSSPCNSNFNETTDTLSHEIIEVLTDPIGSQGWTQKFALGVNVSEELSAGEVSDICTSVGDEKALPADNDAISFFAAGGAVQAYWSNAAQTCVPGVPASPTLAATPIAFSQSSGSLQIGVNGAGFGTVPASVFPIPGVGTMPYFIVTDTNAQPAVNAGNSLDGGGDATPLNFLQWNDTSVIALLPIANIADCDTINATVWNPTTSGSVSTSGVVPAPSAARFTLPYSFGYGGQLTGVLTPVDANGNVLYARTPMTLTVDGVATNFVTTGPFNLAALNIVMMPQPPLSRESIVVSWAGCSGGSTLSSTASILELPSITNVVPDHGLPNGSTQVTIQGYGLSNATTPFFSQTAATSITPQANGQLTAFAPAQSAGPVYVVAEEGSSPPYFGQVGFPFMYFTPDVPVLTQQANCRSIYISISDWNSDGTPIPNQPITISYNHTQLVGTAPPTTDANGTAQIEVTAGPPGASVTVTIGGHASTIVLVPSITTCPGWQQIVQATLSAIAQTASQPVQPVYAGCLVCQAVTCAACNFTDVAFSADNGYIYEVVAWNLMAGVANQFQPNAPAAYAEIVRATTLLAGPRARTVGIRVFGAETLNSRALAVRAVSPKMATQYLNSAFQLQKGLAVPQTATFTRAQLAKDLWIYVMSQMRSYKPVTKPIGRVRTPRPLKRRYSRLTPRWPFLIRF